MPSANGLNGQVTRACGLARGHHSSRGSGGVVEREADLFGRGPVRGVRELGEDAGVGLKLGRVGGALGGEEVVETGGAVRRGGLVVDDPKDVFAGGVGFGPGAEDAVDTNRDRADGSGANGGLTVRVMRLGPGGEGEFAGGGGVGGKQPEAVRVAQSGFQGCAGLAGEAVDGGVGKSVGAQQRGEARQPCGEFGEQCAG